MLVGAQTHFPAKVCFLGWLPFLHVVLTSLTPFFALVQDTPSTQLAFGQGPHPDNVSSGLVEERLISHISAIKVLLCFQGESLHWGLL